MTRNADEMRFEFGQNWSDFVKRKFSQERVDVARKHILAFLKEDSLSKYDFLDIGCGSGLHSLAAFQAGARRIRGFDYDQNSVAATKLLQAGCGVASNWEVSQGDVLNADFVTSLGKWKLVYSWGVLHHTGEVWKAIDHAQRTVADGGLFYIALYSADVHADCEYWLDVKKEYNAASPQKKTWMVWWYIWKHAMNGKVRYAPKVAYRIATHHLQRGMNYFHDIRDWLGGWPMEFVYDKDVIEFVGKRGFELVRIATGEANTEFLFMKSS